MDHFAGLDKHFRAIHHCSVDVSHGLALLFGIGTEALPSWDSKTRRNNLLGGLAVSMAAGPSGHPRRRSRNRSGQWNGPGFGDLTASRQHLLALRVRSVG